MTTHRGRDRSALRYCHRFIFAQLIERSGFLPHSGKRRCGETRLEGAYFRLIPTAECKAQHAHDNSNYQNAARELGSRHSRQNNSGQDATDATEAQP